MKITFIVLVSLVIFGCTSKEMYKKAQKDQRDNCVKSAVTPQDIEFCNQQYQRWLSFEEYDDQRKEVIEQK